MDAKRFAWVVLIFAGGLVLLTLWALRKAPKQPTQADRPAAASPNQPQRSAGGTATKPQATQPATALARPPVPPTPPSATQIAAVQARRQEYLFLPGKPGKFSIGSLDPKGEYPFKVELNTEGAAINTIKLARHFFTVADKQLALSDPQAYQAALREKPEKYKGHYSLLNPVVSGETRYRPLATRSIAVTVPDRAEPVRIRLNSKAWDLDPNTPRTSSDGTQTIRFSWLLYRDTSVGDPNKQPDPQPLLKLIKTYQVKKNSHSLLVSLALVNLSSVPLKVAVDQAGPTGVPREDLRSDGRRAAYGEFQGEDKAVQPRLKPAKDLNNDKKWPLGQEHNLGGSDEQDARLWLGHINKYFGSLMYLIPGPEDADRLAAPSYKAGFYLKAAKEGPGSRTFVTGMKFPAIELGANQSREICFDVFAGPKMRDLFYGNELYKKLNYIGTIDFGGCICAWDELTLGMMWLLGKLSLVSFGNYGLAIILLVILVRLVLHPLTKKGQVSMVKMQKLAPQMQKLKEKYADDKATLNREMMRLYKGAGATPILGCLPMLLQLPIWIALWTALNATVELRHSALLPVWITDLAAPDALFSWTKSVWLIGNSFNLLPILLTVAMYLQTKLNPQMGQVTPEQQKQQNMMKVMMPAMMLLFFYRAPSGLTLYIMASTFAGVAEQYVIRRHIKQREQREAAAETTVRVPGKGPRSSRPKKPRGPFWVKGK